MHQVFPWLCSLQLPKSLLRDSHLLGERMYRICGLECAGHLKNSSEWEVAKMGTGQISNIDETKPVPRGLSFWVRNLKGLSPLAPPLSFNQRSTRSICNHLCLSCDIPAMIKWCGVLCQVCVHMCWPHIPLLEGAVTKLARTKWNSPEYEVRMDVALLGVRVAIMKSIPLFVESGSPVILSVGSTYKPLSLKMSRKFAE